MQSVRVVIPPFSFEVGGARVDVLEIIRTRLIDGTERFHVAVRIVYKGIKSRVFTLDVKDADDLVNKATVEVNKIKWYEYAYGLEEVRRLIT
jgi:hypothetical protein